MANQINRALDIIQTEGVSGLLNRFYARFRIKNPSGGNLSEQISSQVDEAQYRSWIEEFEPGSDDLRAQVESQATFTYRPRISLLTPVFNPDLQALSETIDSVLNQTYACWELCLVDGASTNPDIIDYLAQISSQDERIKYRRLRQNQGISGNTNAAVEIASGDFVAFLDHDDQLSPFALFEVMKALHAAPETDLLYSDHDLLSEDGRHRFNPLFKPDWSPEIMLSANYITHLTVIRKELVRSAGGFNSEMDGAQDWDLFFRITEKTEKIVHIPMILYHWRVSGSSTANNIQAKSYAPRAQLRAIKNHLLRSGLREADASFDPSGYIRVRWSPPALRRASIIIPSPGANKYLESCVESIRSLTKYPEYEIIIVNNGARVPEEFAFYSSLSVEERVKVVHFDGEFNYSGVNNFGAKFASGELLLFLNNDIRIIDPDWLSELVMWAEREEVGAVGAKLLRFNGRIQHAGVIVGLTGFAGHIFSGQSEFRWTKFGLAEWYRDYHAVTAACIMLRKDVFDLVGGFNEDFILCGSDVELCLRVWDHGLRVVYNPFARLQHHESVSRGNKIPIQDFEESYRHYFPLLETGDQFFNPSLSYWHPEPVLSKKGEPTPLEFVTDYLNRQEATT